MDRTRTTFRISNQNSFVISTVGRTTITDTFRDTTRQIFDTGVATRTGTRTAVVEQFETESLGDRVVSRDIIPFARSRNIEFSINSLKPNTQVYAFFDGVDVSSYCIPKLLEINMISGAFQVGETVKGSMRSVGDTSTSEADREISFRLDQANHRSGTFDSASEVFTKKSL